MADEAERILFRPPWSPRLTRAAEGIWLVQGDLRHGMNVYLLEDGDGVTAFDAGTKPMVAAVKAAADKLGGLKRVVLGHSHSDHRGTAPHLGVPVYCHPDEVRYAKAPSWRDTDYWDIDLIEVPTVRWLYKHWLHNRWDGGAVQVAGTVQEGDDVCGFRALHFPGHAPGQIGLWRESDRVILCTDTVYFADSARLKPLDYPTVPHRAWNWDHEKARQSVRKLAELNPRTIMAGHDGPKVADDFPQQLERAAEAG